MSLYVGGQSQCDRGIPLFAVSQISILYWNIGIETQMRKFILQEMPNGNAL